VKIVVVGGRGFLGRRAVSALSTSGAEVVVAGRSGPLVVDLARPETFTALAGADVVVNASSSHAAPPDALVAHCLAEGLVLLEASSDRVVVERLLDRHRGREAKGALVLGAGIFTGVSNALARAAIESLPGATSLELGVETSPFSGAGGGTVDLMADVLALPTASVDGGARVLGPSVAPGPSMPFYDGPRATLHVPFAEPAMIHASTGVPSVRMFMAPRPAFLRLAFLAIPAFLSRTRLFVAFMRAYFSVLRRLVLRTVSTRVGLVAVARRGDDVRSVALRVEDGFALAGVAIAATALALAERSPRPTGTFVVDELVPLDAMLARARRLAPSLEVVVREGAEKTR
jgi:short subunit dehydrogenase-like uncharacterized protein